MKYFIVKLVKLICSTCLQEFSYMYIGNLEFNHTANKFKTQHKQSEYKRATKYPALVGLPIKI